MRGRSHILPRIRIRVVIKRLGILRSEQGLERVDHDRVLVGLHLADTLFGLAGVRAVRNSTRMLGDTRELDAAPTHKLTVHVIEDLV